MNPIIEPIKFIYSARYVTLDCMVYDTMKISEEELHVARERISSIGMCFRVIDIPTRDSLQKRDMHDFFAERAKKEPEYKNSPFTPNNKDRPEIEVQYLEFYLFSQGVAIFTENPNLNEFPLVLQSPAKEDLIHLISTFELPIEEERIRTEFRRD